jgi:hypothetical protein
MKYFLHAVSAQNLHVWEKNIPLLVIVCNCMVKKPSHVLNWSFIMNTYNAKQPSPPAPRPTVKTPAPKSLYSSIFLDNDIWHCILSV